MMRQYGLSETERHLDHIRSPGLKPAIALTLSKLLNYMKSVAYQMAIIHRIKDLIPGLASWSR